MKIKNFQAFKNFRIIKMNRKAQVASGITWVVGFLIIFFIIILFISASLLLAGGRKVALSSKSSIGIEESNANLVEIKSLSAFLNTPVENAPLGEKNIREIITNAGKEKNTERAKLFRQEAEKFFLMFKGTKHKAWLNIYDADDEISGIVTKYSAYFSESNNVGGGAFCDTNAEDSELTIFYIFPDKKIALCFQNFEVK